ncbi:MAG: hypothetical protein M3380_19890 [Chloroflexota bacterium]|nr:hypothetical protein [Chloroflexota bacterium]
MQRDTLSALLAELDLSGLPDERSRALVSGLLNLVETLAADLRSAQAENQRFRWDVLMSGTLRCVGMVL